MTPEKIFLRVDNKHVSLAVLMKNAVNVKTVDASGCTALAALPDMPNVEYVDASGCTALAALPDMPNVEYVDASGCTALAALPDMPNVKTVYARGCTFDKSDPASGYLCGGCDSRGYLFEAITVRGLWRIIAGCRNFSVAEARKHWGAGGTSDRPDCLALVEKLVLAGAV